MKTYLLLNLKKLVFPESKFGYQGEYVLFVNHMHLMKCCIFK